MLSLTLDYPKGQAIALNNFGKYEFVKNNFKRSLKYYQESNSLLSKLQEPKLTAQTYSGMAHINMSLEQYDQSLMYYERTAEIYASINDYTALAHNYMNMANVYFYMESYSKANEYFRLALRANQSNPIGSAILTAGCHIGIGAIHFKKEEYEKALENYRIAERAFIENNIQSVGLDVIYHNIAQAQRYLSKYKDAAINYQKSLEIALKSNSFQRIKEAYDGLNFTYLEQGDTTAAYHYLQLSYSYMDSIKLRDHQDNILELEEKYEAEKKQLAILELEVSKTQLELENKNQKIIFIGIVILSFSFILLILMFMRQRRIKLEKEQLLLEQKALRAQMNPHFIFNSLNSIQRMYMQKEIDEANDYLSEFALLLRKVLENSGASRISLKEEIETLKIYLELESLRTNGQIDYQIKIDSEVDIFGIQIPPLLLQPFAENAIWHGILPSGKNGLIDIHIGFKNTTTLICTISDNGVGIDNQHSNSKHKSQGISITSKRLGIENSVKIEAIQSGGTRVTILIPIKL